MDKLIAAYTPAELATIASQLARDAIWHTTAESASETAHALMRMDLMIRELTRRADAR